MKLFSITTLALSAYAQSDSPYEVSCTDLETCNYSCDSRENCEGTGRTGVIPNKPEKACCDAGDYDYICGAVTLCDSLPLNITSLNGGFACK